MNIKISIWVGSVALLLTSCAKEPVMPAPIPPGDTIPDNTPRFELVWSKPMDENPANLTGFVSRAPVVIGNDVAILKMFGGPNDVVVFRNGETGEMKWAFDDPADIGDGQEVGSLTTENGKLIVCAQREIFVNDTTAGSVVWKSDLKALLYVADG